MPRRKEEEEEDSVQSQEQYYKWRKFRPFSSQLIEQTIIELVAHLNLDADLLNAEEKKISSMPRRKRTEKKYSI